SLLALIPNPLVWQTLETASTGGWLALAIIDCSDPPGHMEFWPLLICVALCLSWLLRTSLRWRKPKSRSDWESLLFVPLSVVLDVGLVWTDLPLRLRLAASEPALRACIRQIPPGYHESCTPKPRRDGLFWIDEIQEREGCVFWTTRITYGGIHHG